MGRPASPGRGCPIRRSPDHSLLAAPRGLSQPSTSFIGSWCQGIHRTPLLARRLDLSTSPSRQDQRSLYKKTLAQDLLSVCPERLYLLNYSSILQVREPRGEAQKKPDIRRATTATREVVNNTMRLSTPAYGWSVSPRKFCARAPDNVHCAPANLHYIQPAHKRASPLRVFCRWSRGDSNP